MQTHILIYFEEFKHRQTIKTNIDVEIAYSEWIAGYAQSYYFEGVYLVPEIFIEYTDEDGYVIFGYMNVNYKSNMYVIPIYDSVAGHYEEYPFEIIGLAGKLFKNHKTIDKLQ